MKNLQPDETDGYHFRDPVNQDTFTNPYSYAWSWSGNDFNWIDQKIKVMKLHEDAKYPTKAYKNDACYDLYCLEDATITYGTISLIKTGIAIQLPDNYEAQIRPRSSISKKGIQVNFGTIDSGYRGELLVSCTLMGKAFGEIICEKCLDKMAFTKKRGYVPGIHHECMKKRGVYIKAGDRIAQMAIRWYPTMVIEVVEELDNSDRGKGGFGSSGK